MCSATHYHPANSSLLLLSSERSVSPPSLLGPQKLTLEGIAQFVIDCQNRDQRYDVLCDIYGSFTIGQLILFCEVCAKLLFLLSVVDCWRLSRACARRHATIRVRFSAFTNQ